MFPLSLDSSSSRCIAYQWIYAITATTLEHRPLSKLVKWNFTSLLILLTKTLFLFLWKTSTPCSYFWKLFDVNFYFKDQLSLFSLKLVFMTSFTLFLKFWFQFPKYIIWCFEKNPWWYDSEPNSILRNYCSWIEPSDKVAETRI